jgi:hypothetical protein
MKKKLEATMAAKKLAQQEKDKALMAQYSKDTRKFFTSEISL